MLPPWIIEEIKRKEQEKRRKEERPQPRVYIDDEPLPRPVPPKEPNPDDGDNGVVIIDPGKDEGGDKVGELISFFSP
jgi:hypothetical protein